MQRRDFDRAAELFSTLTAADRSEISSTALSLNPPSLWVTINPTDLHDPIVQVFAGESIDMDDFRSMVGPDNEKRARNLASNPYAATKFFHFLITSILETLFGVWIREHKVISSMGVFGHVSGYYGVVEAQGRGSLHLHAMLWLVDTPSSDEMQDLLKTEDFRAKLVKFADANIRAHLDVLTEETVKGRPREPELAWSRPPDPRLENYSKTCKRNTCLTRFDPKTRTYSCKRRAPFELTE